MWALLSLAVGSFGIGMTEFVVMGLLPDIAQDLLPIVWAADPEAAIAQTGWLITLYALGVVVGAPTIAGAVAKYPRHRVMVGLALALTVFNALTFIAPDASSWSRHPASSRGFRTAPTSASARSSRPTCSDPASARRASRSCSPASRSRTSWECRSAPTSASRSAGARPSSSSPRSSPSRPCASRFFVPEHAGDPGRTFRAELRVFRIGQVWLTLGVGRDRIRRLLRGLQLCRADGHRGRGLAAMGRADRARDHGSRHDDRQPRRAASSPTATSSARSSAGFLALALVQILLALTAQGIWALAVFVFATGLISACAEPHHPDPPDGCRRRQPVDRGGAQPLGAQHGQQPRRASSAAPSSRSGGASSHRRGSASSSRSRASCSRS